MMCFLVQERRFKCEQCDKAYAYKKDLQMHKIAKHTAPENKPKCVICGKIFNYEENLNRHVQSIHSNNPVLYTCVVHGQSYSSKQGLSRHFKSHKSDEAKDWERTRIERVDESEAQVLADLEAEDESGFEADYSQQSEECFVQVEGDTDENMGYAETESFVQTETGTKDKIENIGTEYEEEQTECGAEEEMKDDTGTISQELKEWKLHQGHILVLPECVIWKWYDFYNVVVRMSEEKSLWKSALYKRKKNIIHD